jgi:hypothetical protein
MNANPATKASLRPQGALLAALLAAVSGAAQAARPLITDDARIVDPKSCQVESWVRRDFGYTEYWALPGCNPMGNLEITVGGARMTEDRRNRMTDLVVQGKTLVKPFEEGGWGVGLAFGAVHKARIEGTSPFGDPYGYIPFTTSLPGTDALLHLNVGGARHQGDHRTVTTWGAALEKPVNERVSAIAEVFSENRDKASYQVGARFWIVKDRVQVDSTYGNRGSGSREDRWFSIGLRLLSPAFLP